MIRYYAFAFGILGFLLIAPCDAADKVFKPQQSDNFLNMDEIAKYQDELEEGQVPILPFLRSNKAGVVYVTNVISTEPVPQQMELYFRLHRMVKANEVFVHFSSTDERFSKLKVFDKKSAVLIIDDKRYPLTFTTGHRFSQHLPSNNLSEVLIQQALIAPTEYQIHFAPLKPDVVATLNQCKSLSIEISTTSGVPIKSDVKDTHLPRVSAVLTYGFP